MGVEERRITLKTYHFSLEVPDDFDPGQLEVNLSYPEDITILDEGLFSLEDIASMIKLDELKVASNSVVVVKFSKDLVDHPELVQITVSALKTQLNDLHCTVISMVDDVDMLVQNSAEATKMLQGMLDLVKSKSIIKLS